MTYQRAAIVLGTALGLAACSGSSGSQPFDGDDSTGSSGSGSSGSSGASGSSGSSGSSGDDGGSSGTGTSGADASSGSHASAEGGAGADGGHGTTSAAGDSGAGVVPDGDAGACPAPSGITANQMTALQIINQTRAAMGSPCDTMVPALNTSSTDHCEYYVANESSSTCDANPHVEVSGCADYVAAQFYDRETAAGYTQTGGAFEVMAFDDDPTTAIGQWLGSVYHRTPLLDPRTRDFGYGNAAGSPEGCDTIDLGEGAGSTTPDDVIVTYPYDGQTGVGLSFDGAEESPTPPVPPNGWPSAFPIHVFLNATSVTLTTTTLTPQGGSALAVQTLLPQNSSGYLANAFVIYGNAPLTANTTYQVHVAGTRQVMGYTGNSTSASFDVTFSFTTQ